MTERLSHQEFAEHLPKSADFDRSRQMAAQAAELADATREQLEAEVAAKNAELEQQGLVDSWVEFETTEDYVQDQSRSRKGLLLNNIYGFGGYNPHIKSVAGRFNGLTVLDTYGVHVHNLVGIKLEGFKKERFAVCASITEPSSKDPVFVPLRAIEQPLLPRTDFYDELVLEALK